MLTIKWRIPYVRSSIMWFSLTVKTFLFCFGLLTPAVSVLANIADDISQKAQEQDRRFQEQLQQQQRSHMAPDVFISRARKEALGRLPVNESPCFEIRSLDLEGAEPYQFVGLLPYADYNLQQAELDPVEGKCIGANGIQMIIDRLQNELIARGYVTTRVFAKPQNLQSGILKLSLIPGYVADIRWATGSGKRASRWNTIPTHSGKLLNLRDVEQALENFKRVPTSEADIQIAPGTEPGTSDLVITHQQPMPFRFSATADDSGSPSTGQYQGSVTLNFDNLWTLSDLFYFTYLHDLGGGQSGERGTRGSIVHYSVPWGYGLFAITSTQNHYHQTIAGALQDYRYSGLSRSTDVKISRVLHRNTSSKTSVSVKAVKRTSHNFIDDTEVKVQQRAISTLEWGLNHRRNWAGGNLEFNVNYRKGIHDWGSLPAPEEAFNEGTSQMRLWLWDAALQQSFKWINQNFQFTSTWRGQANQTRLLPQDRLAIGGRYTVRGFDGLSVLSAERGWLVRNELSTPIKNSIQAYAGIDTGSVDGPSAELLVGQQLTGAVLGLRGQLGRVQYDGFLGKPLSKPQRFQTSDTSGGFSVSVNF